MNFNDYQEQAHEFAEYESDFYPWLAINEEAGELTQIMAKKARGDDLNKRYGGDSGIKQAIKSEAGDVLWFLAEILTQCGLSFEDVANENINKLRYRKDNNTIKGSDKHGREQ